MPFRADFDDHPIGRNQPQLQSLTYK